MIQYGDEIGMGDDLTMEERECARTPMQWTSEPRGGFSRAERTVRPVINDDVYGYEKVNVAQQRREPESLLNWIERRIRMRKECPEFGWGDFTVLRVDVPDVLAIRYDFRGVSMLTLHNFSSRRQIRDCRSQNRQQWPPSRRLRQGSQPVREGRARGHAPAVRSSLVSRGCPGQRA